MQHCIVGPTLSAIASVFEETLPGERVVLRFHSNNFEMFITAMIISIFVGY